jgi:Family of unknown function (DUF6223)
MTSTGSLIRVALIGAAGALLGGFGVAARAAEAAQVSSGAAVIGPGSGRTGAIVAAVVALIGVVAGGRALARSAAGVGTGKGAIVALALGPISMALAALHLATNTGGIGTGSGRAGAIVALVMGLTGIVLGGLALARSRTTSAS